MTVDYAQAGGETAELSSQVAVGDPYANCSDPFRDAVVSIHTDLGGGADRGSTWRSTAEGRAAKAVDTTLVRDNVQTS
ncbi:MAG: hypothetical protein ACXWE8_03520 [Solirubrobacterales bacterium]